MEGLKISVNALMLATGPRCFKWPNVMLLVWSSANLVMFGVNGGGDSVLGHYLHLSLSSLLSVGWCRSLEID